MSKTSLLKNRRVINWTQGKENLQRLQALPLEQKISLTERRIKEFYDYFSGQVYVSFSGGKDSTVLLHIVRRLFPDVPGVFVNTGLEYPEIVEFVQTIDNVTQLRPKMPFTEVIKKYGYPVVSKEVAQKINEIRITKSDKLRNKRLHGDEKGNGKIPEKWKYLIDAPFKISHKCCDIMKKSPIKKYERLTERKSIVASMAAESRLREQTYIKKGCNSFDGKRPMSLPMAFWAEQDIWQYIKKYNVRYSKIYDIGEKRTGCMFCMFGCQFNDEDGIQRFERMKIHHPKQYNYCMEKLGLREVIAYIKDITCE